ncbi:MAG: type II/IV secretion system protein [Planctomycetota bacterium]|nr:MAG: type II/IV secretion system protein [Planctomycetota bacterium]
MSTEGQLNTWISRAFELGASDLHFEPDKGDKMRVRMRVDGQLRLLETVAGFKQFMSRIKLMADLDVNERSVPLDGRVDVLKHVPGCPGLDIRLSTLPCLNGEKAVMRLIDARKLSMKLDQLGFSKKMLRLYEPHIHAPSGLILHVGPTGSGKTTSLYAAIQTIKRGDINIQTVENPVEYQVFGITQTQVDPEHGLTFPRVLRALLRQDPDVILVGEIRDPETAEIATEAAMTGHLVLSTLHTNDAVGTVVRLLEMGIAPYCIAYSLRAVVSQRFARRLCQHCKRSIQPPERVIRVTGSRRPIYQAQGCAKCGREGYKGRQPLFEFLPNSPALKNAVYASATPDNLQAVAKKNGLISLWEDGLEKVWAGHTSLEEVLRCVKGVKAALAGTGPKQGGRRPPPPARRPATASARSARRR